MEQERKALQDKIASFMYAWYRWASSSGTAPFEPKPVGLSVDVLEYQRVNHPLYGRYCELSGRTSRGATLLDYPPLPVEMFKRSDVCPFPNSLTFAEFHSSGTTEGVRSIHKFRDTFLLDKTLFYAFITFIARTMPPETRVLSLMPSHENNPHSSLGYMIGRFVDTMGDPGSGYFFTMDKGLDVDGLCDALSQAEKDQVPVHLMGPAYAYVALLDALGDRKFHCMPSSSLLETGGYKNQSREIPKKDLRDMLSDRLGIERRAIYGEYGMCELSSQGYEICAHNLAGDFPEEGWFIFPAWLKCIILNPDTMAPVLPDHEGQIAFLDLCNLDSAAYILTGDIGTLIPLSADLREHLPGHPRHALKLRGRAPDAIPKGCSISWDEWQNNVLYP